MVVGKGKTTERNIIVLGGNNMEISENVPLCRGVERIKNVRALERSSADGPFGYCPAGPLGACIPGDH